jgi:YfiH family protein
LNEKNGVTFFKFPILAKFPEIQHGIFTRNGGHSNGHYRSLNTSFGVGDDPDNVEKNRFLISQCLDKNKLVFASQVHGTKMLVIDADDKLAPAGRSGYPLVGDALVTDLKGKILVVQVADCQSIFLYDPYCNVIANVHCGWRGSINNIIGQAVSAMKTQFGCHPQHIVAGIGPSLGPCCAEFIHYKKEIPKQFWYYKNKSNHFDFWAISFDQLKCTGVLGKNIYTSKVCTKCNTDLFFSYRGEVTTGRFAAAIGLK